MVKKNGVDRISRQWGRACRFTVGESLMIVVFRVGELGVLLEVLR